MKKNKTLYLHQIPMDSKVYEEVSDGSTFFIFKHIDGMYSLCVSEKGGTCHLAAMTPMKKFKDGYKIDLTEEK
jgi:hypothetical protein